MKILMVGNSHVASFQRGWNVLAPHCPNVSITTYPHWRQFYGLFATDESTGRIHMTDPPTRQKFARMNGGDGSFRPLDYDLCLIVGGGRLWCGLAEGKYSHQMQNAAVHDYIDGLHQTVLLRKIRAVSDIPVLIVTNPHFASRTGISIEYLPPFENGLALANAKLGPELDAILLTQPPETEQSRRLSKLEFAVGERMLHTWIRAPSPPFFKDDLCHMNAAFGTIYLRDILRGLGQTIGDVKIPPAEGSLRLADKTDPIQL